MALGRPRCTRGGDIDAAVRRAILMVKAIPIKEYRGKLFTPSNPQVAERLKRKLAVYIDLDTIGKVASDASTGAVKRECSVLDSQALSSRENCDRLILFFLA